MIRPSAHPRLVLLISVASLGFAAACGSGMTAPTMQGRQGLLSQTAVAKKCEEAAKGHDRPFVVEWDATDLASFEAKAARDTIFVKYEGCKLQVLDRCSDQVTPGKFGAYGTPQFTSGTVQSMDVTNEGELYAKLPLGAANLSGRVQAGEALHLKYFVSGVAQDTRDAIYTGDIKANPGCAEATHFVWAYNLGAFELATSQTSSGEASAEVGGVGSAGGRRAHKEQSVGGGGKLASCESQDQRACRVPIRLALRKITPGENPVTVAPAPSGSAPVAASPADHARELFAHAKEKFEQGDGSACLESANRAMGFDSRLTSDLEFKKLRARCVMLSGKCEDGKRDFRATLAEEDRKRELKEFELDKEARKESNLHCSSATATNDPDYITRAFRELKAAAAVKDGRRCAALVDGITERRKRLDTSTKNPDWSSASSASSLAGNVYEMGGKCVAESTKKCADGLAVMKKLCAAQALSGCNETQTTGWGIYMRHAGIDCK